MFQRFDRVVRCSRGHLFTTIWIPGVSIKAVRLGGTRWQRCPVGRHWDRVAPVDESSMPADQLSAARAAHDARIP